MSEQPFYRTSKGHVRHALFTCANMRRSILLGDVITIPADEVKGWEPCEVCCDDAEIREFAAKAAAKADAMCPNNRGVRKPKQIQSECNVCGKRGTVNRSTGSLRAHKRADV